MLALKATYENGKITSDIPLPKGKKSVIITFLEEQAVDLSPEWMDEVNERFEEYKKDGEVIDGDEFFESFSIH